MAQTARLVIEIDSREAERRSQALRTELSSIQRTGDFASRSMDQMSIAVRSLAGYMAGLITVGAAVSKMDTYTGLQNKLKLVTDSQVALNQAMSDTFKIAQNTGQAWDSVSQIYQRFSDNAKRLNLSQAKTAELTNTVAKAIAISGGSATSAEAALIQFSQALSSNVLRGEELNSVMEQAPGLAKAIAQGMGITVGQLRSVAAEGKITGDVLVEALGKAKASVDDLFGKTDFTIANSFTQLSNAVTKFVGEAGSGSGAAQAISASLSGLANNLETVTNVAMVGGAYWMGTLIPVMYKSVVASGEKVKALGMQTVAQYTAIQSEKAAAAQEVVNAQAKLASLQATKAQLIEELKLELQRKKSQISTQGAINSEIRMGLLRRQQAVINAELTATENALAAAQARTTAASAASMGAGRALLGVLGGPVGLGLTVAGVAATYLVMNNNTRASTAALEDQKKTVSELVGEYKKLTLEKLISQQGEIKKQIQDSKNEISSAFMSLERLTKIRKNSTQDEINRSLQLKKVIADLRKQANDGTVHAGEMLSKLGGMGFNENEIAKIEKYTTQLANGSKGLKEFERQQALLSQQTGIYGDKLDENQKKIAEKQSLINGLTGDYENLGNEVKREADTLIEQAIAYDLTKEQMVKLKVAREGYDKGTISSTQLAAILNENLNVPKEALESFSNLASRADGVKVKLDQVNGELKKQNSLRDTYLKQSQSVLAAHQEETKELNNQIDAKQRLNALDKLREQKTDAQYILMTSKNLGGDIEKAKALLEYRKQLGLGSTGGQIPQAERKNFEESYAALQSLKAYEDKITESKRNQTKELEKQEKLTKRLVGISGNSGIGTGAHLDVRYGGSMSGQRVSNEHLARLKAADKPLSSFRVSSDYGPRKAPTKGASSFHKGIDFAMPVGTPITTNVAVKDVQTAYDSKGGGYYSTVTFEDGVVLKLLHQSPSMQGKVKGGASKGSDKSGVDIQSQIERQLDAQRALENEVAGEVQRIKNNLTVRLEEVDKAGFTPERSAEIKAELQRRADNDIAIAQQALRTKLDDYKEFQKTEAVLLKENFDRRKFNAAHDIELSKAEQKQAVELLEQQYQQELGLMQLAQEQRLFQAKLVLMSETEAMQERYRLEREEILKNTKLSIEERQKMITFSKAAQENEMRNKIIGAVQNWGGIQADMNGYGDFYRQDQERTSRLGAAQDLFDSKSAAVDYNEQGGLDAIKAQMEQQLISQQEFEDQKTAILQAAQDQRNIIAAEYAQNAKDIEDKYQQDRLNTQIMLGQQMMGSLTSMFGSMFGEQSKAYKIMFAADKAYAIAAAGIAIQQNIAAASKAGFPYNLPLIAGAIAQGASIIANIRAIKDQGFADGGYTGKGGKYELAGAVHKGEVVWSQADIKRWGGVNLVESMRKSANPEAFLKNNVPSSKISTGSDLVHDGKVYFSPNGLVQDRSNLEDVYDFTLGRSARPQAESIAAVQPSAPTINFKIEVVNQVQGVAVEAEQMDDHTVRLIVKDELEKTLPRAVPRIVSEQMDDPSSSISRSLSKNTTARRNR